MSEVKIKTMYLVSGQPMNGKTTFSLTFLNKYPGEAIVKGALVQKENVKAPVVMMLDEAFLLFWNKKTKKDNRGKFSIPTIFSGLNQKDHTSLGSAIIDEIEEFYLNYDQHTLIVDGWLLDFYKNLIVDYFKEHFVIYDIVAFDHQYFMDGEKFVVPPHIKKADLRYKRHMKNIGTLDVFMSSVQKYIIQPVQKSAKLQLRSEVLCKRLNYHYFEDLKVGNPIQQSKEKYIRLNLDNIVRGKRVLDIGCNSGYNSIRIAANAKSVTGIDIVEDPLKLASIISGHFYNRTNIRYFESDIFNFDPELTYRLDEKRTPGDTKYDVILCASTMHYFVNRQGLFIEKCRSLLSDKGILVLECGVHQEKAGGGTEVKFIREEQNEQNKSLVRKRQDGVMTEYPTERYLFNNLCAEFDLIYTAKSVDQAGDDIPRNVYHFRKK